MEESAPQGSAPEAEVAAAPAEPMDPQTALQKVLQTALWHDSLARGLSECVKALDRREAHLCVLSSGCDDPKYTKLITALCHEHNIPMIKVEDSKLLGEWVGLCKRNAVRARPRDRCCAMCSSRVCHRRARPSRSLAARAPSSRAGARTPTLARSSWSTSSPTSKPLLQPGRRRGPTGRRRSTKQNPKRAADIAIQPWTREHVFACLERRLLLHCTGSQSGF
jgi:ribosomal protein L7Ae-like RNA K-turn-binding protein